MREIIEFAISEPECKAHHIGVYITLLDAADRIKSSRVTIDPFVKNTILGISSYTTLRTTLKELEKWSLIKIIQFGINQYVPTLVEICSYRFEQAPSKHINSTVEADEKQINSNIDAPDNQPVINNAHEQPKEVIEVVAEEVEPDSKPEAPKKKTKKPSAPKPEKEYDIKYKVRLIVERMWPGYYWKGIDMKQAGILVQNLQYKYREKKGVDATDEIICKSVEVIIETAGRMNFLKDIREFATIVGKVETIILETKKRSDSQERKVPSISERLMALHEAKLNGDDDGFSNY